MTIEIWCIWEVFLPEVALATLPQCRQLQGRPDPITSETVKVFFYFVFLNKAFIFDDYWINSRIKIYLECWRWEGP